MRKASKTVKQRLSDAFAVLMAVLTLMPADVFAESFSNYEIRVIRPRYFSKSGRMELGGQMSVVMNQTFVYSYLATGILDYHINEQFAVEGFGSYGVIVDKEDKRLLESEFEIQTQIIRTKYQFGGGLLWTPIYGKYQLSTGRVVYFDTFITAGVGMTGVEYTYKHCQQPDATHTEIPVPPADQSKSYFSGIIGIGQRFFISKQTALRWDVRDSLFSYSTLDQSCDPEGEADSATSKLHQNVSMQLGASYFL